MGVVVQVTMVGAEVGEMQYYKPTHSWVMASYKASLLS